MGPRPAPSYLGGMRDGYVNTFDSDPFVALLTGGGNSAIYLAYTWDAENRLVGFEPAGTPQTGNRKAEYGYDYLGRRIEKQVWTYAAGWELTEHRKFIYDGWRMVLELDGLDSDAVLRQYTWGRELAGQSGNGDRHVRSAPEPVPVSGAGGTLDTTLSRQGRVSGLLSVRDADDAIRDCPHS